jgi:hypothetical protein
MPHPTKSEWLRIRHDFGLSEDECNRLSHIKDYLLSSPDFLSWRALDKPNLNSTDGVRAIANKYSNALRREFSAIPINTTPDAAVAVILSSLYGYKTDATERIKVEHQHAMIAENLVGELLEHYLAASLEPTGWVWCAGSFVKAIDFIKPTNNGYELLQVKNRDNTENSSSKAIRKGTPIKYWFRFFSRTGATNWDSFPDTKARKLISETGFAEHVRTTLLRP